MRPGHQNTINTTVWMGEDRPADNYPVLGELQKKTIFDATSKSTNFDTNV